MNLTNYPSRVIIDEYENELSRYVSTAQKINGVEGIITMGSVKAPGLSDIDVICVVDDKIDRDVTEALSTASFNRNLFLHGPIVIPKSLISDLQYILYASNLQLIWGHDFRPEIESLDEASSSLLSLAYVIDFSESRLMQYDMAKRGMEIDVRGWMTRLWSLVHTQKLCIDANVPLDQESLETISSIRHLRQSWVNGSSIDDAQFKTAFIESEATLKRIIGQALDVAQQHLGEKNLGMKQTFYSGNKRIVCSSECNEPFSSSYQVRKLGRFTTTTAPIEYAPYLFHYATPKTQTSGGASPFAALLQKRRKCVAELQEFHIEKKCTFSLGGYLGLPTARESKVARILKNVVWRFI